MIPTTRTRVERNTSLHRGAFLIPAVVAGCLLQHTIQGWCAPLTFFRRLGFQTAREIHIERMALQFVRGAFKELSEDDIHNAGRLMAAVGG
jgi:hypothetical protein